MLETIIIFICILLDQLTKLLVKSELQLTGKVIEFIPGVIEFKYSENTGMAFGMLDEHTPLLAVFSVIMSAVMLYMIFKNKKTSGKLFGISMAMITGGAIGNAIDRIFRAYVVDFIDPVFIDFAIFNVADSFICVGAFLLAVYLLFIDRDWLKDGKEEKAQDDN